MPRGGAYDVASDNAMELGDDKITGAPAGDSDVNPAPPLPLPLAPTPHFFSTGTGLNRRGPLRQSRATSRRHWRNEGRFRERIRKPRRDAGWRREKHRWREWERRQLDCEDERTSGQEGQWIQNASESRARFGRTFQGG